MAPRRLWSCQVAQCLCCSLRAGVIAMSVLALVNASLAFAGEAALFSGMLTAVAEKAAGTYLPAGTKLPSDQAAQGGLIFLGLYSLLTSIFGFIAAARRTVWAASAFWVMMLIDTGLGIAIAVILWMSGGSFQSLLAQIPFFIFNSYMVVVASSYRTACKAWAAGEAPAPGLPSGGAPADGGAGSAKAPAVEYTDADGVQGGGVLREEEDGDTDTAAGTGAHRPSARV